jgi:hypothetical protein
MRRFIKKQKKWMVDERCQFGHTQGAGRRARHRGPKPRRPLGGAWEVQRRKLRLRQVRQARVGLRGRRSHHPGRKHGRQDACHPLCPGALRQSVTSTEASSHLGIRTSRIAVGWSPPLEPHPPLRIASSLLPAILCAKKTLFSMARRRLRLVNVSGNRAYHKQPATPAPPCGAATDPF